jgi:integrase
MALSDTKLKNLKAKGKPYQLADGRGLFIEVMPGGKKTWRLRYRLQGRQEKVTLGEYPAWSLSEARQWCENCRGLVAKGVSPMQAKRDKKAAQKTPDFVKPFADQWMAEVIERTNRQPRNIRRVLDKDVFPAIGKKRLGDVTVTDILEITDRIKARGSDQVALLTRNVLKRLFAYAIARQKISENPAAAVEAKYIATARSREVALTPEELGNLLRAIYSSSMRRSHKLALHLLIITMVRKSELLNAKWEEIDFDKSEWHIPAGRMKKDKAHVVYLSTQAKAMFEELRRLACNSDYVLPSRSSQRKPISSSTLNVAIRTLDLDIQDFVIHDFRRSASTHLHEACFNSDVIEKALAHEQKGVRGVYNKAEYADQRKEMLQWWANFVDSQIEEGRKVVIGRFSDQRGAA